jgi:NAD(P)-dependent dehydrogenase (short-subunit alcohol dehydrogenase family)
MGSCEGRVALVAGASRGIGAAIATRLAAEGASVALSARTVADGDAALPGSLTSVLHTVRRFGVPAVALEADLSRPDGGRDTLVARAEAELGPVDILVNVAATDSYAPFLDLSRSRVGWVYELNLFTPWELCRAVLPGMRQRGRGWIVNISSFAAEHPVGPPYRGVVTDQQATLYGSTKAALNRFTTSLAAETFADGLVVNALAPDAAVKVRDDWPYPDSVSEPVETMAEAALALATVEPAGDATVTGRVNYSLSLLVELGRPVRTLDGTELLDGWQPGQIDPGRLRRPVPAVPAVSGVQASQPSQASQQPQPSRQALLAPPPPASRSDG